jgi:hypothetical protein
MSNKRAVRRYRMILEVKVGVCHEITEPKAGQKQWIEQVIDKFIENPPLLCAIHLWWLTRYFRREACMTALEEILAVRERLDIVEEALTGCSEEVRRYFMKLIRKERKEQLPDDTDLQYLIHALGDLDLTAAFFEEVA